MLLFDDYKVAAGYLRAGDPVALGDDNRFYKTSFGDIIEAMSRRYEAAHNAGGIDSCDVDDGRATVPDDWVLDTLSRVFIPHNVALLPGRSKSIRDEDE